MCERPAGLGVGVFCIFAADIGVIVIAGGVASGKAVRVLLENFLGIYGARLPQRGAQTFRPDSFHKLVSRYAIELLRVEPQIKKGQRLVYLIALDPGTKRWLPAFWSAHLNA